MNRHVRHRGPSIIDWAFLASVFLLSVVLIAIIIRASIRAQMMQRHEAGVTADKPGLPPSTEPSAEPASQPEKPIGPAQFKRPQQIIPGTPSAEA